MDTIRVIYCDNQGHVDDMNWPPAVWKHCAGHKATRYVCDNCRRLAVLIHPAERVHFERLTLSSAGTQYDQEKGNRT